MEKISHTKSKEKHPLQNWIPYKLNFEAEEILCEWLYIGEKQFTESFFDSTILACKNYIQNKSQFKSTSSIDAIFSFIENIESIEPTAFIFHVSRSGSTLLTQLFSLDKDNIVVAEAPFFDQILREIPFSKFNISEEEIIKTFKASIYFYGKKRNGNESDYFIKLDSWHLMYYEIIRKAFPETPFIFSFRKPEEVLKSHQKQAGLQAVPGLIQPEIFGIDLSEHHLLNHNFYLAVVLEKYFEKLIYIIENDKNCLFIDYSEGVLPIINKIEQFLKLNIKPEIKEKMAERSQFHSKKPNEIFDEKTSDIEKGVYFQKLQDLYINLKKIGITKPKLCLVETA